MVRTPKVTRSASRVFPADSTVASAEYKFGDSGDHSAGLFRLAVAVNVAEPSGDTDCAAESAVPTTFPE